MTYGSFSIGGIQTDLPGGGQQSIGPWTVACSDTQWSQVVTINTTLTLPVPSGAYGVIVVPPAGGTTILKVKTVSGDTGIYVSPSGPSLVLAFDTVTPNVPSDLYFVSGGSVAVAIQFF